MNNMPMPSSAMTALMSVAMMVAMMLPSVAPSLWRYHHHLAEMRAPRAARLTTLFALGYASMWSAIGLALFALSANISRPPAPWVVGLVVLCAGAAQCSPWKSRQLLRCRRACVIAGSIPTLMTGWRDGCRLGVDCGVSCAAPMAVLLVAGLMDMRMMAAITAAITAERVAPAGPRVARVTGAFALVAGLATLALGA